MNGLLKKIIDIDINDIDMAFISVAFFCSSFPVSDISDKIWVRKNGNFTLSITTDYKIPFGPKLRLIFISLTTSILRQKQNSIFISKNEASFLKEIGISYGKSSIESIREQITRLSRCSICIEIKNKKIYLNNLSIEFNKLVSINEEFAKLIKKHSIPINFKIIKVIKESALSMDIYFWLTHRMFNLRKESFVSWENIGHQFGSSYCRSYDFKKNFIKQLRKIMSICNFNISIQNSGLLLFI